ncbi:hypothetical protein SY83_16630 [Paenibacillus swuensis]|uniref:Uncharacterized protein n=1 Tax=Paenibacillus swuensis TaxID=1178515 RepID=A0A172TPK8_9BACL|nr:hypothetical protein [Paenibacillus swuensis]ANE48978.1 hypothetical protein SY83_16630 [Paenibacillus swuensis]
MSGVARLDRLDEEQFTYRITKDQKVIISFHGKQVTILTGKESNKFMSRIGSADFREAQLMMAKATGNFKRGNE